MGYYSAIKRNEALCTTTWMNLRNIVMKKPVLKGHVLDDAVLEEMSRIGKSIRAEGD